MTGACDMNPTRGSNALFKNFAEFGRRQSVFLPCYYQDGSLDCRELLASIKSITGAKISGNDRRPAPAQIFPEGMYFMGIRLL